MLHDDVVHTILDAGDEGVARPRPPHRRIRVNRSLMSAGLAGAAMLALAGCASSSDGEATAGGGEANLALPDLSTVTVMGGLSGRGLLMAGLLVCVLGLGFGLVSYLQLRNLPVHVSMREVSELIYSTCKAYLVQQGKFLMILWGFIASVIVVYYAFLVGFPWGKVAIVIAFSLIGMAGS